MEVPDEESSATETNHPLFLIAPNVDTAVVANVNNTETDVALCEQQPIFVAKPIEPIKAEAETTFAEEASIEGTSCEGASSEGTSNQEALGDETLKEEAFSEGTSNEEALSEAASDRRTSDEKVSDKGISEEASGERTLFKGVPDEGASTTETSGAGASTQGVTKKETSGEVAIGEGTSGVWKFGSESLREGTSGEGPSDEGTSGMRWKFRQGTLAEMTQGVFRFGTGLGDGTSGEVASSDDASGEGTSRVWTFDASTSGAGTSGAGTSRASTSVAGTSRPCASGASTSEAGPSGASTSGAGPSGASTSGVGPSGAGTSRASTSGASTTRASTSRAGILRAGTSRAGKSGAGKSGAGTSGTDTSGAGPSGSGTYRSTSPLRDETYDERIYRYMCEDIAEILSRPPKPPKPPTPPPPPRVEESSDSEDEFERRMMIEDERLIEHCYALLRGENPSPLYPDSSDEEDIEMRAPGPLNQLFLENESTFRPEPKRRYFPDINVFTSNRYVHVAINVPTRRSSRMYALQFGSRDFPDYAIETDSPEEAEYISHVLRAALDNFCNIRMVMQTPTLSFHRDLLHFLTDTSPEGILNQIHVIRNNFKTQQQQSSL